MTLVPVHHLPDFSAGLGIARNSI